MRTLAREGKTVTLGKCVVMTEKIKRGNTVSFSLEICKVSIALFGKRFSQIYTFVCLEIFPGNDRRDGKHPETEWGEYLTRKDSHSATCCQSVLSVAGRVKSLTHLLSRLAWPAFGNRDNQYPS